MTLIEQIKADREAGTDGPWRLGSWQDNVFGTGEHGEWLPICRIKRDDKAPEDSKDGVDARRIARVPDMEAALLAADELAAMAQRMLADRYDNRVLDALAAYRKAVSGGDA